MKSLSVLLCVVFLLPHNSQETRVSSISEVKSQHIIKNELHKISYNFQATLRKELSMLELEMYSDFLSFAQEIIESQDNLSDDLNNKLSEQMGEVMLKFSKVMTFSSLRIQELNDELNRVAKQLGGWIEEDPTVTMLFNHDLANTHDYYTATLYSSHESSSVRNRRHAVDWQHLNATKTFETTSNTITTRDSGSTGTNDDMSFLLQRKSDPSGAFSNTEDNLDESGDPLFVHHNYFSGYDIQSLQHTNEINENYSKQVWN